MSTDTETDTEKKKKGRTGSPFYIQERYDRELELAPVKVVEEILSWQAPEREWERNMFLCEKAIDLTKKTTIEGDVIARALCRLLFSDRNY